MATKIEASPANAIRDLRTAENGASPLRARPLRILLVIDNASYLRLFDSAVHGLLERGHDVSLALNMPDFRTDALRSVTGGPRRPEILTAPPRRDRYTPVARRVRATMDYVRFLEPRFARAEYYRNKRRVTVLRTGAITGRASALRTLRQPWVDRAIKTLTWLEDAIPSASGVERFIEDHRPDVLLVTPLVLDASPQTDYVKSARALGIPSALCVASWDNLTNKGLMRVVPDSVIVWNETQRAEAVDMHGADPEQITVTGAQSFDRWFGREPSTDPDDFRRKVGLPPGRPFVLYVGSTSNIARAGVEEGFVRRWLEALRSSDDPSVVDLPVLVRPHPERPGSWYEGEIGPGEVRLWPPEAPVDVSNVTEESRRDYFDSLFHAAAVVGINTSAMLEAAVLDRPVLSVRAPEIAQAHEGTLHFDYLLPENGGFLHVAADFEEHAAQLAEAVRTPERSHERNARFVERFIRPNGVDRPANPMLIAAVERLAGAEPRPPRTPVAIRYPLWGVVRLYAGHLERRRMAARGKPAGRRLGRDVKRLSPRVRPYSRTLARALRDAGRRLERASDRRQERVKQSQVRSQASRSAAMDFGRRLLNPEGRADDRIPARYAGRDLSD